MTQLLDYNKTGAEQLLALVNAQNNKDTIGPVANWTKFGRAPDWYGTSAIGSSICISPNGAAWPNNTQWVLKKVLAFKTGNVVIRIRADDSSWVIIDGVSHVGNSGWNNLKTLKLTLEPGYHTIAIRTSNATAPGYITFDIKDDGVLVDKSDATWTGLQVTSTRTVAKLAATPWTNLTLDDVLFITPPEVVGSKNFTKNFTLSAPSSASNLWRNSSNLLYELWDAVERDTDLVSVVPSGGVAGGTSYFCVHLAAKVGTDVTVESNGEHVVYNAGGLVNGGTDSITLTATDAETVLWIMCTSANADVIPNLKVSYYNNGGVLCHANKYNTRATASDISRYLNKYSINLPDGYIYTAAYTDADSTEVTPETTVKTTKLDNSGYDLVNVYVDLTDAESNWDVAVDVSPETTYNTRTTIAATDDVFDIKKITVQYNRIDIDEVFSLAPVKMYEQQCIEALQENETEVYDDATLLAFINEHWGVTFTTEDFTFTGTPDAPTMKATAASLIYNGSTDIDIRPLLSKRVLVTTLSGFTNDQVAA